MKLVRNLGLAALLAVAPGCATIIGTAFSPVTGGVDLVVETQSRRTWYLWLPTFVGGAVAGPFVAIYNGIGYDADIFDSFNRYWGDFDKVFRPFEMIGL